MRLCESQQKKKEKRTILLWETSLMVELSTSNLGPRLVPFACKCCASMFHCAIRPSGHTATRVSQDWSPGTPWGGFDPSHHPPLLFWAPPGTTPTTLQRVVENTAFLSESGSWDNMVCLSTTTFPGLIFGWQKFRVRKRLWKRRPTFWPGGAAYTSSWALSLAGS